MDWFLNFLRAEAKPPIDAATAAAAAEKTQLVGEVNAALEIGGSEAETVATAFANRLPNNEIGNAVKPLFTAAVASLIPSLQNAVTTNDSAWFDELISKLQSAESAAGV